MGSGIHYPYKTQMLRTGSETKSMVVAKPRDANDEARRRSHGWTKGDGLSEAKKLKQ